MARDELPAGWKWQRLSELCNISLGRTPSRSEQRYWGGANPWATISDLNEGQLFDTAEHITDLAVSETNSKPVPAGTLLMSFKLSIGKMAFAGRDLYTNEAIAALHILNPDELDNHYLYYALKTRTLDQGADEAVKGKTLNKAKLQVLEIPLPPLPEQRRIVARIEEFARRVEEARGLRREAVEGVGAILPSARAQIMAEFGVDSNGAPLGSIVTFLDHKRVPLNSEEREKRKPGSIPYYGASGVFDYINEYLFDETLLLVSEDGANIERRATPIAFVITGKSWVNNHAHVLRCQNDVTAYFLAHFIENVDVSPLWPPSTRPKINKSVLEQVRVPNPPLDEQRRIVAYLNDLQAKAEVIRAAQVETQKELGALMPSVLAKAFRGEL